MESEKNFRQRVFEATGVRYDAIPIGVPEDLLGGQIFCRRGGEFVVTHGYPDRKDSDGAEVWDATPGNFRRVTLKA